MKSTTQSIKRQQAIGKIFRRLTQAGMNPKAAIKFAIKSTKE
jgi:hypothetical protein